MSPRATCRSSWAGRTRLRPARSNPLRPPRLLESCRAALLSVLAREQYIHEAHTIILRDHSHVGHHDVWVDKLGNVWVTNKGASTISVIYWTGISV